MAATTKPKDRLIPTPASDWTKQTLDSLGVTYERNPRVGGYQAEFSFSIRTDGTQNPGNSLDLKMPEELESRKPQRGLQWTDGSC